MSKFLVETFYTCSFKIVHKLDELNEKKLSELEKRNDGEVQIIDVKLNNRKTKTLDNKNFKSSMLQNDEKKVSEISSKVASEISSFDKGQKNDGVKEISNKFYSDT